MPPISLKFAGELMPNVQRVLARVTPQVRQLLPDAEVDHIALKLRSDCSSPSKEESKLA